MPNEPPKFRADVGAVKVSDTSRLLAGDLMIEAIKTSALYANDPDVKTPIDKYLKKIEVLRASLPPVVKALSTLGVVRGARNKARKEADTSFDSAVTAVEGGAGSPSDLSGVGLIPSTQVVHGTLPMPVGILHSFDHAKDLLKLHVKFPVGVRGAQCDIEISPSPATVTPDSYRHIVGTGVKRDVPALTSGSYLVRAATTNATERSDWFGPVVVVIK